MIKDTEKMQQLLQGRALYNGWEGDLQHQQQKHVYNGWEGDLQHQQQKHVYGKEIFISTVEASP
jgi:hypothetical protein